MSKSYGLCVRANVFDNEDGEYISHEVINAHSVSIPQDGINRAIQAIQDSYPGTYIHITEVTKEEKK